MTDQASTGDAGELAGTQRRLAVLLAMAMFVLVVDTSMMNVSISAVVRDLDTTVSGVQSAIALEALVSAAFILIGSKVGDLIGRKRAYVLGLLGYAVGAAGDGTRPEPDRGHHLLGDRRWDRRVAPAARHAVPHPRQLRRARRRRGPTRWSAPRRRSPPPSGRCSAASSRPILSWRVGVPRSRSSSSPSCCPASNSSATCPTPGPGRSTSSARSSPSWAWAASCWASWCGRRAARRRCAAGARRDRAGLAWPGGSCGASVQGKPTLLDPDLFTSKLFRFGISGQMLQQIALGGTMIVLPIYLQMVLEYNAMQAGLSLAPLSLSMFVVALLAGKKAAKRRPSSIIRAGVRCCSRRPRDAAPDRAPGESGWYLLIPLLIAGSGLGLLVSQLNNYTLSPDLGGAGQRGRRRELGGRLVRAVVRLGLRRRDHAGHARRSASPHMAGATARCCPGRAAAGRARRWRTTPR